MWTKVLVAQGYFVKVGKPEQGSNASAATYTTDVVVAMLWLEPFSPKTTFGWGFDYYNFASSVRIIYC